MYPQRKSLRQKSGQAEKRGEMYRVCGVKLAGVGKERHKGIAVGGPVCNGHIYGKQQRD